jgi:F-type H+-transporting ATPase subunit b
VLLFTPAWAQEAVEEVAEGEAAAVHGVFPPFDPATFASQLFWLAVTFGLLYYILARAALPRIARILEERKDRVADDLAEAERLRQETDEAIAAYEQALAEARQKAHRIAQSARDAAKEEVGGEREELEEGLEKKVAAAEARIAEVKDAALAEVDGIAREAAEAMVEVLIGTGASKKEIAGAVDHALAAEARP